MCIGVPGEIKEFIDGKKARADVRGNLLEIDIRLVPAARVGETVLIHAGFALTVLNQEEAGEMYRTWEEFESYAGR